MGLFDIFKKKKELVYENENKIENKIETLLRLSTKEASYRPEFYKKLLTEKLIVLTAESDGPSGVHTLEKDTAVSIVSLQNGSIPVFTSLKRIFDNGVIKEEIPYMEMKGEDLFNLTKTSTLILNPFSDFGKELIPDEIENILEGKILTQNQKNIIVEEKTEVLIGQPKIYPKEIVNSLVILFSKYPSVNKAYLGWIINKTSDEPPHYIFAVDIDGDSNNIINEAGFIANQYLNNDELVDFMLISSESELSSYFIKDTEPFYTR